ncbi:DNA repair protein RadC [Staphylococcus aureus]|nr:DNA repair protein RadC [Staphylococcus aureus]MBH4791740.1 DNA repair protein RadC [Staphylococcus aureus]MBH4796793.1 DNA repair protein RadC [Staphylococcus aureus]MBH4819838.1 DNA repair protein RadC [Staphylococcus aureus]MBH4824947.1 DNA repair protein RadC [Staphylococcus aureus]
MKEEQYILKILDLVQDYQVMKDERFKITQPSDVVKLLQKEIGSCTREHFVMIGLNTKNEVTTLYTAHIGTLDMSIIHPRDSFQVAILNNCKSVIFAHNHPSQDVTPSVNDIVVSKKLKLIGDLLSIDVLDSLVVSNDKYESLAELELLETEININDLLV